MLLYYDIFIGDSLLGRSQWTYLGLKLPAIDPKSAIVLHSFMELYEHRKKNPWKMNKERYFTPAPIYVHSRYRQLIEYTKIPSFRKSRADYKKIRTISQHEILSLFKHYDLSTYK